MRYWKYKAYNADGDTVDGIIEGKTAHNLILQLRQSGLQVYDIQTIPFSEYLREKRLSGRLENLRRLHAKIAKNLIPQDEIQQDNTPQINPMYWYGHKIAIKQFMMLIKISAIVIVTTFIAIVAYLLL